MAVVQLRDLVDNAVEALPAFSESDSPVAEFDNADASSDPVFFDNADELFPDDAVSD